MPDPILSREQLRADAIHAGMPEKRALTKEIPFRAVVLNRAIACTVGSREQSYGSPTPNMTCAGKLKETYQAYAGGKYSVAHDEAIELLLTKVGRIATGAVGHIDNYVDGAAYFAIAAECQNEFRNADDRLERMDAAYQQEALPIATGGGMLNPYAPANKKP